MAKQTLALLEGETLIGSEIVAMRVSPIGGSTNSLFVTNQRICFPDPVYSFSHTLDEIEGFTNGFLGATTILTKAGKKYTFTTSSAKKVKEWLRQAGVVEKAK